VRNYEKRQTKKRLHATSKDIESQGYIGIPRSLVDPYTSSLRGTRQRVGHQVFTRTMGVTWKLLKANLLIDRYKVLCRYAEG